MKKYVSEIKDENYIGLPADIMKKMKLKQEDELWVGCDAKSLTIVKNGPECLVCGAQENLCEIGSKRFMCEQCLMSLHKVLEKNGCKIKNDSRI